MGASRQRGALCEPRPRHSDARCLVYRCVFFICEGLGGRNRWIGYRGWDLGARGWICCGLRGGNDEGVVTVKTFRFYHGG